MEAIVSNGFRKLGAVVSLSLAMIPLAAVSASAQEFSADVVTTPARASNTVRVCVGKSKMRLQTLKNGQPDGAMIWDARQGSATIVMDRSRSYIGGSNSPLIAAAMNGSGAPTMLRIFAPTNSSDPCTDWNNAVLRFRDSTHTPPHFVCQSLGSDAVNGRPAEKFLVRSTSDGKTETGYAWIDSRLHVVSKSKDSDSQMELANVQEGPQPDAEFQVPAGYRPVDTSALLAQLKGGSSALADMFGSAASDVGNNAANSAADAAKQKANDAVKKKIKGIFHMP